MVAIEHNSGGLSEARSFLGSSPEGRLTSVGPPVDPFEGPGKFAQKSGAARKTGSFAHVSGDPLRSPGGRRYPAGAVRKETEEARSDVKAQLEALE